MLVKNYPQVLTYRQAKRCFDKKTSKTDTNNKDKRRCLNNKDKCVIMHILKFLKPRLRDGLSCSSDTNFECL